MNGHHHAISNHSVSYEENVSLLDEKSLSDIDSDAGRADLDSRFPTAREWARFGRRVITGLPSSIPQKIPSRSACRSLAIRAALFLLPSFVSSRLSHEYRSRGGERLSPTAYLDGMRGLAAFIVFFCHYFYTSLMIADGWGADNDNYYLFKLPFLRLTYAGPPMVAVFFIISGYALSLKPLKLARTQKWADFTTTMSSFVFRRAIRLFLPTAISTLMIVFLLRIGAYEWNREFSLDKTYHSNVQETAPPRLDTLSEQLIDWTHHMFRFIHVWGWERYGGSTYYDVHLWTIPVEFRASMMLFLALIGLARLRTTVRIVVWGLLTLFTYYSDRWEMVLFLFGMFYAELDIIRGAHSDPATTAALAGHRRGGGGGGGGGNSSGGSGSVGTGGGSSSSHGNSSASGSISSILPITEPKTMDIVGTGHDQQQQQQQQRALSFAVNKLTRFGWALLSIFALYLMSQPDAHSEITPGWVYLSSLIPEWIADKYRYWQCNGAILFVFCVARMPSWQRFFNSAPIQYLGRISYAIYLMHGPVMHTVGYGIERWAWSITGTEGAHYYWGFWLASIFIIPSVVWGADLFWRAVDAPVVRFAKWFESKCIVQPEEQARPSRS